MNTHSRRQFLRTSTCLALGSALAPGLTALAKDVPKKVPVVDTHLHCFAGAKDARFPYHPKGPYQPEQAATPEHLLHCMDGAGVDFAVVVHPEPYQDDHRYLEHCLKVGGPRLKGTCLFFADQPGFAEKMQTLVKKLPDKIVAARIHAYAPDRLPPFGKPELKAYWKTAADLGLAVQLHFEPRYAPGFEPLIREFPQTTVIIDHLGRPFQGTPEEHAVVLNWAKLPNTVMKLAAIPSERSYPHRDIAPVITQLAQAYGPDRMIYGGGFGSDTTPKSYRAYREMVAAYLGEFTDAQRQQVLGGNAARLCGFQ